MLRRWNAGINAGFGVNLELLPVEGKFCLKRLVLLDLQMEGQCH